MGKRVETISLQAMEALRQYRWPGNVRELQNVIERSVILSSGPSLNVPVAQLLPITTHAPGNEVAQAKSKRRIPVRSILTEVDRNQIIRALKETEGRIGGPDGAAARVGLKRTTFITRMRKLGIEREQLSEHDGAGTDASDSSDTSTVRDSRINVTPTE